MGCAGSKETDTVDPPPHKNEVPTAGDRQQHAPSYKVVVVGDRGVGKTSIIRRMKENAFLEEYFPTERVSIHSKSFLVNTSDIGHLQLWDIPGEEAVDMKHVYFRDCDAVLIVLDVTRSDYWESANRWATIARQLAHRREVREYVPVHPKARRELKRKIERLRKFSEAPPLASSPSGMDLDTTEGGGTFEDDTGSLGTQKREKPVKKGQVLPLETDDGMADESKEGERKKEGNDDDKGKSKETGSNDNGGEEEGTGGSSNGKGDHDDLEKMVEKRDTAHREVQYFIIATKCDLFHDRKADMPKLRMLQKQLQAQRVFEISALHDDGIHRAFRSVLHRLIDLESLLSVVETHERVLVGGVDQGGVFGVPLSELLKRNRRKKLYIPEFFAVCVDYLRIHGKNTPDIFRQKADSGTLETWKERIESGEWMDLMHCDDPHIVANLMIHFFKSLPSPLVPEFMTDRLCGVARVHDLDTKLAQTRAFLTDLPHEQYHVMRAWSKLLNYLSSFSEKNHMTTQKLSSVGWGIARLGKLDDMEFITRSEEICSFIEVLITHAPSMFALIKSREQNAEAEENSEYGREAREVSD